MSRNEHPRDAVLKASRAYYAHHAYYEDLLDQSAKTRARIKRELDFLESIFRAMPLIKSKTYSTLPAETVDT